MKQLYQKEENIQTSFSNFCAHQSRQLSLFLIGSKNIIGESRLGSHREKGDMRRVWKEGRVRKDKGKRNTQVPRTDGQEKLGNEPCILQLTE